MGVPAERMSVVPVGVDETIFRPLAHVREVPGRLMTTASSDVPMKGLVPLLEALARVRADRPDTHLVVIGRLREGSSVPGVIERLRLGDAVTFVTGVSEERIVELYAEAQLAVVPSLYEGFSLPAIEAMACGRPLVATTGGAIPEVVGSDGRTALLVPPNDPQMLALEIRRALEDEGLRHRLGEAGRRRVLEKFTWQVTAKGTLEQYRALLEDRSADSRDAQHRAGPSAGIESVAEPVLEPIAETAPEPVAAC